MLPAIEMGEKRPPIFFYAFDLLRLDGAVLRLRPLSGRKARLERLPKNPPGVFRFRPPWGKIKVELCQGAKNRPRRPHRQAQELRLQARTPQRSVVKIKFRSKQEFVIGGYTPPGGTRKHFGALLAGVYKGPSLVFVGKVGTGFDWDCYRASIRSLKKFAAIPAHFPIFPRHAGRATVSRLPLGNEALLLG